MFKKIMIGSAIGLGVAAVAAGVTCTALYFTKWKDQGKNQEPEISLKPEISEGQIAFMEALENSTFTKPLQFTLNDVPKQENQEEAIIAELQKKWGGSGAKQNLEPKNGIYQVTLSQGWNRYTNKIYKKDWADILKESENADFKNISKVVYGFTLEKKNETTYELVPKYIQAFFETKTKPTWLEKPYTEWVKLSSNKALVSTITIN